MTDKEKLAKAIEKLAEAIEKANAQQTVYIPYTPAPYYQGWPYQYHPLVYPSYPNGGPWVTTCNAASSSATTAAIDTH